jgi:hypothetical protein
MTRLRIRRFLQCKNNLKSNTDFASTMRSQVRSLYDKMGLLRPIIKALTRQCASIAANARPDTEYQNGCGFAHQYQRQCMKYLKMANSNPLVIKTEVQVHHCAVQLSNIIDTKLSMRKLFLNTLLIKVEGVFGFCFLKLVKKPSGPCCSSGGHCRLAYASKAVGSIYCLSTSNRCVTVRSLGDGGTSLGVRLCQK